MEKTLHKNIVKRIDIVKRIELELLSALFNYAVPFINKKISSKKFPLEDFFAKSSDLENIINNPKPNIELKDVKELGSLLSRNLSEDIRARKKVGINPSNILYSFSLRRRKKGNENAALYAVSIKYEENQTEEKFTISIKRPEKDEYSAEVTDKKGTKDKAAPYSIIISYEDNYAEERLTITYRQQLKGYIKQHIESKEDMSNRVPLKWLNILPETMMGGVLGFTYLGENFMARRADLTGKTARMVDIHESIHTPDEYETRVLTSWIMEKVRGKYVK